MQRLSTHAKVVGGVATLSLISLAGRVLSAGAKASAKAPTKALAKPMEPLRVGTLAPNFTLPDQDNKPHKLSASRGKLVVLAFYPADMTKGCTLEAHNFTNTLNEFTRRQVQVFGISVQDVKSKRQFCDQESIKYPLLADTDKKVVQAYGVLSERGLAQRVSFIIGKNGKIVDVERVTNIPTHAHDLLAVIDKLQAHK